MNVWRYITRSLGHYRRTHLSVMLAVAVSAAVLTGAFLVGDSVRGSLRALTLERLGAIDYALVNDRFFDIALAEQLEQADGFASVADSAVPACFLGGVTVERPLENEGVSRVSRVNLIGCDDRFWSLDTAGLPGFAKPGENEVVLNQQLAESLGARVGDSIVLRLPDANQVPADSPLGRQEGRINSVPAQTVVAIVPNKGLARFSLHPSQQYTSNVFVPMQTVQNAVDQPDRVNAIFVAGDKSDAPEETATKLASWLSPTLEDYGFTAKRVLREFGDDEKRQTIWDYVNLTTDRMMWDEAAREATMIGLKDQQPQEMLTYLANTIRNEDAPDNATRARVGVPYSTVTAVENDAKLGPLVDKNGSPLSPLASGEIVLNLWTAEQLKAKIGDRITLDFFEPETTHGKPVERSESFRLAGITHIVEPAQPYRRRRAAKFDQPPTLSNDPDLTPTVEGVTDQESIEDWDPPFPFDQSRIQDTDDEYWDNYRTTPKAFISLADGKRIWGSRFGAATSIRMIASDREDLESISKRLRADLRKVHAELGFRFNPVKSSGLKSARGTTPFEFLFVGFSFFLIASALMLVAILFRLTVELRAASLGILAASGWSGSKLRSTLVRELAVVAMIGAAIGVVAGIGYAAAMLWGLRNLWVAAIVTPFLQLHINSMSLLLGFVLTFLIAIAVVWMSLRKIDEVQVTDMLAGKLESSLGLTQRRFRVWLPPVLLTLSAVLAVVGAGLSGEAQAGSFFGSGSLVLTGLLLFVRATMYRQGETAASATGMGPGGLAWRNATRNPGRSTLTIGLMASATFLIIAIAAFRLAPTESGTGGYPLMATSDRPMFVDFANPDELRELFGAKADDLVEATILPMRVMPGDDASCRNLYQSTRPTLLGVTEIMLQDKSDFAWGGYEKPESDVANESSPWACLQPVPPNQPIREAAIAVVLDKNTAMYSLHLPPTVGYEFTMDYDPEIRFRIAGLLSNTTLQGSLLMHESDLVRLFPASSGYQKFLVRTSDPDTVTQLLEQRFGDEGLDVVRSTDVLKELLAVQNTYLSTFQSLGALGLLLGSLGLAAVQIRNVLTRRSELALMSAMGFSRKAIRRQLVMENAALLFAGLGMGCLAALVAIVPHAVFGSASFPLATILSVLIAVSVIGIVAGRWTTSLALQLPVLAALRGE